MTDSRIPADLPDHIQHYIDGAFVDSVDGDTFDVLDPVTNKTYTTVSYTHLTLPTSDLV